ncbi:MAG: autotransporter-associated beta strand repeat-containing protein [Opitutales bacterium]|nr:autotransporter-associated beta strand repeat-containing protein [Opitutales bacterium]
MKLRSTLLFAAASLSASALAPVAFSPSAYGAGESISINFASGQGAMGGNWNDTTGASGTVNGLKDSTGTTLEDLVLTYTSKNVWNYADGVSDNVLKGYLDDGNEVTIGVSGISYLAYDVTILAATDTGGAKFSAKTINGTSYYGDGSGVGIVGNDLWGATQEKTINGNNSFTVSGLFGDLSITSVRNDTGGYYGRGCVAGIIITNAYDGTEVDVSLDGTAVDWTDSAFGSEAWTNSTEDAGTYAALTLTADTAVNVTGTAITTDAIIVKGSGAVTFSGNAVSLIGPAMIRTEADSASIVINNKLTFSDGGSVSGNISFGENGALSVLGGTLSVDAAPLDNASVAEGATVNFAEAQTGKVNLTNFSGAGTLGVTFSTTWDNNSGVSFDATKFTGGVNVLGGNFTLNAMSYNDTLSLSSGVNMQLISGSSVTFSKNLVLSGTTEIHQNGGANLTFDENSTITGAGTYVRRGGGTLTINGAIDLGGFTLGTNNGTTNFAGSASLGEYNQISGTSSVSGTFSVEGTLVVRGSGKMTIGENATLTANWVSTNTGGTITQNGGTVTAEALRLHDLSAGSGNSTYNLTKGLLNVTGTTKSNSTSVGVLIGHWGNGKGILNVSGGVLNAENTWAVVSWTSPGEFNISGGEVNIGGICLDGQLSTWATDHSTIVTLSGGRLNVGSDGLRIKADGSAYSGTAKVFNLNGGTLGALDSWGTSDGIALGGSVTIDTQTRVVNSVGASTDGGVGATISLGGVLSGAGNITKAGAGTLMLSGANTFTGDVTVSAGTVVAGNATALGTGTVSLAAGTTLKNGMESGTVTVGTLTTVAGAILNLGTSASTTTAAFASTNTATLAEGTIFDAQSLVEGMQLVSGLGDDYDASWLTSDSLRMSGAKINSRSELSFAVQGGVLVLEKYTAGAVYYLTWAGTDTAFTWTSGGSEQPWTNNDGGAVSTFETGDSVTFGDAGTNKTVKISGVVNPAALAFTNTEGNDYTFSKAEGAELAAIVGVAGLTKDGSGSVTVDKTVDLSGLSGAIVINAGTLNLDLGYNIPQATSISISGGSLVLAHDANITLPVAISGAGTFEKSGTGTMVLTGGNGSFTGDLVVSGGVLKLGSITALGAGYSGSHTDKVSVFVKTGGTLDLNGMTKDGFYENFTLAGGALINTGAEIGTGARQLNGGITLTADSEIGGTSGFGMVSGGYAANTLNLDGHKLTKTGTNAFYLINTTITAGTIDIQGGEISQVNSAATAAEVDFIIGTAGALRMSGMDLSVKSITSSGDGALYMGGATLTLGGDSVLTRILTAGTVKVSDGVTLTLVGARFNAASFALGASSTIKVQSSVGELANTISGDGALVKETDGVFTLAGANTYSGGTTVSAGTLKVTKNEALGVASAVVNIAEGGTLELAFGGTFSRALEGAGTVAKSGTEDLEFTSAFSGSFSAKEGLLAVNVTNGSYKNLSIASGATFKALQNMTFETVSAATGALTGVSDSTRVSVSSGAFAGTLSNVSLVKTGNGTLDLADAKFATGGKVVVESGTVENLTLADGGTLQLSVTETSSITLSNLSLGTGMIYVDELFTDRTQATISGNFTVTSGATVELKLAQLVLQETQKLFTFTDETKSAWETAFGELTTDGKFNGGTGSLTISGIGTVAAGVFSWGTGDDANTLYFKEARDPAAYIWSLPGSVGEWGEANWIIDGDSSLVAFESGMTAVFNETSVGTDVLPVVGYAKGAQVVVDDEVVAGSVSVDVGADACVGIIDNGGTLTTSKGISIESGALAFFATNSDFYKGNFDIGGAGTLILRQPTVAGSSDLTLYTGFSGAGTILYATADKTLTLSGDRSKFTGTLDVDAGTVVLGTNGTGTETFGIDVAEGATVAVTGGAMSNGVSSVKLDKLAGTGTLRINSPAANTDGNYVSADLTGSTFTGIVELNALDLAVAGKDGVVASNLANAGLVRLTNGSSLNFFNSTDGAFAKNIDVAADGAIRVAGTATASGNISGAGTLTVKDGGKLILSGAVGTADSALGGLTLSSGELEISGENSSINVSGNVSLTGSAATINTNGTIGGNVVSGAWGITNPLTLGGNLSVGGNVTFVGTGQTGRITTVLENAKVSVAGTTSFEDNEALTVGAKATYDSAIIKTSQWGLATTLGAGATLSAGTLTFGKATDSVTGSADGDASRLEIGTADGTGTLSGTVVVKDVSIGVRDGATSWTSSANLKLNGGATTFDVGADEVITLNGSITEAVEVATGTEGEEGYVAATASTLIKTGAGTLALGQANANKGGTQINGGVLKYTSSVTLGGEFAFGGGALAASGTSTVVSVGTGATLSGNVVLTSERSGKVLFTEDLTHTGSFTLDNGAIAEIAESKTLTLSSLTFTNGGSTLQGAGTLALAGTLTSANNRTNTISSNLTLSADSTLAVSSGTLKFTGENLSTGDYTLTKTGAGTLVLDTDAVYEFRGSLNVTGGKVDLENRTLTIGEGDAFGLQNATLTGGTLELGGTSADKLASATLGGGTSKIEGDVSVANTALTFGGKVTGIGTLTWGDGNTVVLTDAFKATFSGTTTLLDFNDAVDADGNALTAETSFAGVFKEEIFLGRDVELVYNADATSLDITVTGTLQWNGDVAHWVQTENVDGWDAAKWDVVTKNGLIEKGEAFSAGKFVEFNKAGSITLVGTASRIDGTIYGTGPINTAGMIFNIADNGQFRVTAAYESADEDAKVATYLQGVAKTDEEGNTTYVDDGITILAGNVTFDATVDNRLTGGMRIFGGELWVSNEQSLGDGTITLGDSTGTTAAKLGFNGGTTLEQKVIIGNEAVTIDVADGRGTVTISNALEKDATATTAKLTKAGAGTLVIQSGTALDGITVSGGKLTLADDGNAIGTKVFAVGAGATLNIANGAETGENSTLENLTLAGALTVDGDFKAFRAGTISVVGDASITGNLYVGSGTSFKNGEKDVAGTLINVASGASLALTGNVNAYGTDAAALYKQGAGSLRFASNATLDADFVHSGGTVIVSEGLTATKSYTVDGAGTRIQINSGKSATFSNFAVTETGRLTVQINPNANAVFNGFAAADSALTVFAGTDINSVRTATINGNGKDVALGNIEIGGLTKQQWLVNLTVDADKIKAGTVSLGAASMLKLATAGADATAKALVVESYQGQVSTLDLSSGVTFKLENTENIAVLQGAGTLKVVGGTLSVKGQNYSSELSPKVLLDGATFNFEVTGDGTKDNLPVYSSLSAISTTEKGGTVSKSGTGTLVLLEGDDAGWFTPTSDMAFNGTIAANGGDLQVYATMSNADVAIAADGRLTVFAEAELGDSVDEVNTLAKKLSGTGTLVARGYLYANGGLDSFDGKLIAGGDGATDVGYLYVYNTTEAWLSSGAATRGVGVENGGMIFAAEADVALKAVSLTGSGALYGSYDLTTGEEFSLSVDAVNATSGSTLELLGTGTLGALSFADAADGSTATNTLALSWGDWTLSGASTNLTKVAVDTGMLTVANAGALGTAGVSVSDGVLSITADGQYANAIELSGDAAAVQALGEVDLSGGTLSSDASTKIVFVAGKENNDGTKTTGTLTLSETVFGLATGDITFNAVDGTIAVNTANAQTFKGKLSGAGTFEKTGAGTLTVNTDSGSVGTFSVAAGSVEFGSAAQLKAHGETTGTLSVANGASAKINGTNLSEFVLGGEGTVTVDGGELAGMKDAKNVSVNAGKTLSVSGDISGSTVALNDATLKTNGTAAQTISGTTLSGATVTLSNENASAAVVYDSTVTLSDATTLVLNAGTGISGGEFAGAYDGSLTKTGDGKWTVSGYTYGKNGGEALNVNGGTLEWKNANFGSNAGTISLGTGATLSVNGLASGDTLAGTVSGDASTTLEIANTTLTLATTVATDAKWGVKISDTDASNGNAVVTINSALPGRLEVAGTATAKLALGSGYTMEMGENDQLTVAEGATLELASGTLTVANASKDRLNTIDGNVTVAAGSTFAQNAGIRWNTGSTLDIEGTYSISVGDLGNTGWNKAKITGAGTLEIKNTSSAGYDISGEVSDFAGTLSVASGAKVNLTSGASFDDVANVEIDSGATLEVAHDLGGALDKLSGAGNVVINADSSKNNFPNAVYAWGTNNAGFSGNVAVKSGALAVSQADLTSLGARLSVGGEHVARYSESTKFSGIYQGAFLKVTTPGSIDVSVLGQNGGMILSGGEYVAGTTFGNAGKGNLYVVEKDSTLKLAPSADVNGSLFVAYGATLDIGATSSVSMFRANGTGGNNVVNGDFTLNGTLVVDVDESNVNKTLVDVTGTTNLASGKQGPAKVEIYAADTTTDLSNSDITIFNNYKDTKRNLEDVVEVEVMGRPVEVSRDAKGNIVVVSAVNDYTAPSGLQDLYGAIRGKGTSALWSYLKSDRANAEMMDSKLVALSPVSYGSLVEMQSGFVALENDLLRDRLEQRRYERAFASNAQKQFKPFVNILGSQREGDGNGTESANYDVSHTGAIGGFDVAVSRNTIFGVSLGFDWAKADLHDGAGKHEGDTTRLGVYGMSVFENAYFGYGLSAGATSFDTKRNSGYNGETLTGSTDGNDVNASVIFGAGWTIDEQLGLDLAPYVGLDLGYAYAKSFTEEGGKQTALDIEKMERWSLRGKIGATLSWRASERTRISFDASFSHEFLDSDMDIDATFASGDLAGTAFSSTAYLMDENTISIGPRVDYRIDDTWSVSGGYSYETDLDDTVTHSANVGFRARF